MSAIWCLSFRKLDKQVISQSNKKFVYARIEFDSPEDTAFMPNYHVTGFSTLLVLNTRGDK